jgi:hypothetical protein
MKRTTMNEQRGAAVFNSAFCLTPSAFSSVLLYHKIVFSRLDSL